MSDIIALFFFVWSIWLLISLERTRYHLHRMQMQAKRLDEWLSIIEHNTRK